MAKKKQQNNKKLQKYKKMTEKIFRRMGFQITDEDITDLVTCKRGAIERILKICKTNFSKYEQKLSMKQMQRDSLNSNVTKKSNADNSSPTQRRTTQNEQFPQESANNIENENQNKSINGVPFNVNDPNAQNVIEEKDRVIAHLTDKMQVTCHFLYFRFLFFISIGCHNITCYV